MLRAIPHLHRTAGAGLLAAAIVVLAADPPRPAGIAAGSALAKSPASVSEFTLANGIRVVVVPDHRVPIVTHMVWYAVGSVEEGPDEHGVAHYLEHMMFKGTAKYPKGAFDRFVAGHGGQQNASTWSKGTMYWQRAPKSSLPQLMDMEADRMTNLRIDDADVASERAVVMEELRRQQVGVAYELSNLMRAASYGDHPEGRAVIGTAESIAKLDGAKAQSFYERFYGPSRATVIVAGDVTDAEVRELSAATYAKVPVRDNLAPRVVGRPPLPGVSQRVQSSHERATTVSVYKSYLTRTETMSWRDQYIATLFAVGAGNGMTSRLFRGLVAEQSLATNVACSFTLGATSSFGTLDCSAAGRAGVAAADIEAAMDKIMDELADGGLTDSEFDEVKSRFIASEPLRRDNVYDRASGLGGRLSEGVPLIDADNQNNLVNDVTRAEVGRVARQILTESRKVTGVLLPKDLEARPATATAN